MRGLPHATVTKVFLAPCNLNAAQEHQTRFESFNPLTFRLTAAAWSRILSEYVDSGLLDATFDSPRELRRALNNLSIQNPTQLQLEPDDIVGAETFDAPAVQTQTAAGRGRGHGGRGGGQPQLQPSVPGPPALTFLDLSSLTILQQPDSPEPLLPLAKIVGLLGACHTRASRMQPTSPAALFADLIVPNICSRLGAPNASPALVASNLADFLASTELPDIYLPTAVDPAACREELLDGIHYRGTQEQRATVERRRCLRLGAR